MNHFMSEVNIVIFIVTFLSCTKKLCIFQFYLDPPKKVTEAMQEKGLSVEDFFTTKHGEVWETSNPNKS